MAAAKLMGNWERSISFFFNFHMHASQFEYRNRKHDRKVQRRDITSFEQERLRNMQL